jgi:hypothetical protein
MDDQRAFKNAQLDRLRGLISTVADILVEVRLKEIESEIKDNSDDRTNNTTERLPDREADVCRLPDRN